MRAALLVALLPGLAAAQEGADAAGAAREACAGAWAVVQGWGEAGLAPLAEGKARPAAEGWCEVVGFRVALGEHLVARADALRFRGEGLDAFAAGTGLPVALEVEAEGLRAHGVSGIAALDWAYEVQSRRTGVEGRLALGWDEGALALEVTEARLDFPGRNAIEATARIEGVDLGSPGALATSVGSMAVTRLDAFVESDGLFESHVLVPLASWALVDAEDPEAAFEALRADLLGHVAALPPDLFPDPTRAELAELAAALPAPTGRLDVALDAAGGAGLGAPRFLRFGVMGRPPTAAELWDALGGLRVEARWTPAAPAGPDGG